jgi:hypothetical protein
MSRDFAGEGSTAVALATTASTLVLCPAAAIISAATTLKLQRLSVLDKLAMLDHQMNLTFQSTALVG